MSRTLSLSLPMLAFISFTGCASDDAAQKSTASPSGEKSPQIEEVAAADDSKKPAGPALEKGHQAEPRADATQNEAFAITPAAQKIVDAPDRTDEDRKKDPRRHPAETMSFIGAQPGWRVVDLGAGSGYTTELLVRSIGETGKMWMHNDPRSIERFFKKDLEERLQRDVMKSVVRVDALPSDALPDDATDLDAVVALFTYHDFANAGADREKLNRTVFERLKPGGIYVLADHQAPAGSGLAAAGQLHRLEESILRAEVEAAGFVLDGEGHFLRDPTDTLEGVSYKQNFICDRYMLRFKKPAAK